MSQLKLVAQKRFPFALESQSSEGVPEYSYSNLGAMSYSRSQTTCNPQEPLTVPLGKTQSSPPSHLLCLPLQCTPLWTSQPTFNTPATTFPSVKAPKQLVSLYSNLMGFLSKNVPTGCCVFFCWKSRPRGSVNTFLLTSSNPPGGIDGVRLTSPLTRCCNRRRRSPAPQVWAPATAWLKDFILNYPRKCLLIPVTLSILHHYWIRQNTATITLTPCQHNSRSPVRDFWKWNSNGIAEWTRLQQPAFLWKEVMRSTGK